MSTGLSFDPGMSALLEAQYTRPAMVLRRARALELADPKLGEDVLDVGCGPGFLTADLSAGVGENGSVLGIDQSESMLELARKRCDGYPQTRIEGGDAAAIGGEDARFDLVVSTQVLEYVADIDRALGEIARVLRPGGRTLLLATDWRSVAWYSSDESRMDRMLRAWEEHLAHPTLPRTLGKRLENVGLEVTRIDRHSILEGADDRTGYSAMLIGSIAGFAIGRQGITEEEARAWAAEQEALRADRAFHFSIGQYYFSAVRPGSAR
ncbi:MAG TPA: methyltransferase domain-containing protein [Deltaproteobacteria bacterium]|nr:methyltransferase domain-containing protein [Deltaproteobacteria bacterium]